MLYSNYKHQALFNNHNGQTTVRKTNMNSSQYQHQRGGIFNKNNTNPSSNTNTNENDEVISLQVRKLF